MLDIDTCIGFITNKAGKRMGEAFNERLMHLGITKVQWMAMYYLSKSGRLSQKELGDKMDIKESTVVRLIDRMEKEELVERIRDIKDRRISYISLTEGGKRKIEELIPEGEKMSEIFLKNITDEEIQIFKNVLAKMLKNIS